MTDGAGAGEFAGGLPDPTDVRAFLEERERSGAPVTPDSAREALAGNLCRCTGYGRIVASVLAATRTGDAR